MGNFEEVATKLQQQGYDPVIEEDGSADFLDIGISLWREDNEAPQIDSVSAFTKERKKALEKKVKEIREEFRLTDKGTPPS